MKNTKRERRESAAQFERDAARARELGLPFTDVAFPSKGPQRKLAALAARNDCRLGSAEAAQRIMNSRIRQPLQSVPGATPLPADVLLKLIAADCKRWRPELGALLRNRLLAQLGELLQSRTRSRQARRLHDQALKLVFGAEPFKKKRVATGR